MVKTFKNLLQNQESFEAESWYIALGTQALPSLLNNDHRLTFDLFYGKVRFAPPYENVKKSFSQYVLKTNG